MIMIMILFSLFAMWCILGAIYYVTSVGDVTGWFKESVLFIIGGPIVWVLSIGGTLFDALDKWLKNK